MVRAHFVNRLVLQPLFDRPQPSNDLDDVKFRRIGCVTRRLMQVSLRQVCVMSGCLMVASLMEPGGFAMMLRRQLMVLSRFGVMFRCLF
jgi:hypothetical protein